MIIKSASDFVDAILQIWPPFRWDEVQEKAWTQLMVRNLDGFSSPVLDRAFQDMASKRKETKTPTPAECISACAEAKRWMEMEANKGKLPEHRTSNDPWSRERKKLAYDMIKSGMGRQAAKDNPCWVLQLWDFCRNHQRMPAGAEVDALKREAQEFDDHYARLVKGAGFLPFAQQLIHLGDGMLAKRKALSAEALGR